MEKNGLMSGIKNSFIYQELARAGKVLTYSPKHRYSTLATALFLGSSLACGDGPIEPKIDEMPKAVSPYIGPTEGMAPHSVEVRYSCIDDKGISEYSLSGSKIIYRGKNPIDTILTFTEPGNSQLKVECTDTKGQTASYGPIAINVSPQPPPTKSFSQSSAVPEDSLRVTYSATAMENLDSAKVRVQRDEIMVDSMVIKKSQIPFTKTYDVPGAYRFISDIPGLKPDTTTGAVKDYIPVINLSSIPADSLSMNEGDSVSINLESRIKNSDPNPGDNPVIIDNIISDGKVSVNRNGYDLVFSSVDDSTGAWKADIVLKNSRGKTSTATLQGGRIYDLLDVSGFLEDAETHQRVPGIVNVFNFSNTRTAGYDSTEVGYLKLLDSIPVSTSGSFSKKLEHRIADLTEDILIRARWIENGKDSSYIRTMKFPKGDKRDLPLRVTPYTGLVENGITPEDFRRHAAEVLSARTIENPDTVGSMNWNPIILKWNSEGPEVIVSRSYCNSTCDSTQGYFNSTTADSIARRFLDSSGLGAWVGRIKNVRIENGWEIETPLDYGRLVVYPEKGVVGFTNANDETEDGYLDIAEIHVGVDDSGNLSSSVVIGHEGGHASGLPGHAWRLPATKTTSKKSGNISTIPLFADVKLAKSRNEDSYKHGEGNISARNWLGLKYVLGLNF